MTLEDRKDPTGNEVDSRWVRTNCVQTIRKSATRSLKPFANQRRTAEESGSAALGVDRSEGRLSALTVCAIWCAWHPSERHYGLETDVRRDWHERQVRAVRDREGRVKRLNCCTMHISCTKSGKPPFAAPRANACYRRAVQLSTPVQ